MIINYKGTNVEVEIDDGEEKIGELLSNPTFGELVFNEKQKEFMKLVLTRIKKGENHV